MFSLARAFVARAVGGRVVTRGWYTNYYVD